MRESLALLADALLPGECQPMSGSLGKRYTVVSDDGIELMPAAILLSRSSDEQADAKRLLVLAAWQRDYNAVVPNSKLGGNAAVEIADQRVWGAYPQTRCHPIKQPS